MPRGYYTFIMFFFRCSPENSTFRFRVVFVSFSSRLRLVFVSSPCLAGRLTLFIYYLLAFRHDYFPVAAFFISMHQRVNQRFADGSMCRRLIYALSCRRWHWRKRNNSPTNSEEYRLWLACIRQSGLPADLSMKRILSS